MLMMLTVLRHHLVGQKIEDAGLSSGGTDDSDDTGPSFGLAKDAVVDELSSPVATTAGVFSVGDGIVSSTSGVAFVSGDDEGALFFCAVLEELGAAFAILSSITDETGSGN